MEPFQKEHDKVKGIEVLFFQEAELEKSKGDNKSFASSGPLSVLYFRDYNRFVLHLNDWRYPLMRRLPCTSEKGQGGSRCYEFPALNGYCYKLRINGSGNSALSNFDNILSNFSNYSVKGTDLLPSKLEVSPDDKLYRHQKEKEIAPTGKILGVLKQGIDKVMHATESFKPSTKKLVSRKKKYDLKDIKNKNFRKEAKSTFNKNYFSNGQKQSKEFLEKRKNNTNLSQNKEFKELLKTTESNAPALYLWKVELEEAILNNKDLINQGGYKLSEDQIQKTGFVQNLKQGIHDIKESVTGMLHHGQQQAQEARGRDMKPSSLESQSKAQVESEHYSG